MLAPILPLCWRPSPSKPRAAGLEQAAICASQIAGGMLPQHGGQSTTQEKQLLPPPQKWGAPPSSSPFVHHSFPEPSSNSTLLHPRRPLQPAASLCFLPNTLGNKILRAGASTEPSVHTAPRGHPHALAASSSSDPEPARPRPPSPSCVGTLPTAPGCAPRRGTSLTCVRVSLGRRGSHRAPRLGSMRGNEENQFL